MPEKIVWDQIGERTFEAGIDHGVLYPRTDAGEYTGGKAWNGLTGVTETPSGGEANKQYADNIPYLSLTSAEEFGATVEALTYPDEWAECDGSREIAPGVTIGQQNRRTFGLSYRTIKGNDVAGQDHGYKLHIVYGCQTAPSERAYTTINDNPEALAFSWTVTTTPIDFPGYKPVSSLTFDSTKIAADKLAALEQILYGSETADPRLPTPAEILEMFKDEVAEFARATMARHMGVSPASTRARTR